MGPQGLLVGSSSLHFDNLSASSCTGSVYGSNGFEIWLKVNSVCVHCSGFPMIALQRLGVLDLAVLSLLGLLLIVWMLLSLVNA